MRVQTEEWRRFIPGVRMYKGKKTLFWNGEPLWDEENREWLDDSSEERQTWEVIIILSGVEVISDWTFFGCKNAKTVIMADTVKRIEEWAFYKCKNLDFVKLSSNVEYIGGCAFGYCKSLTSMFIPDSCREIANAVFDFCINLIMLHLPQHTDVGFYFLYNAARIVEKSNLPYKFSGTVEMHMEINERMVEWIKSINDDDEYVLHRLCSSMDPSENEIYHLICEQGGLRAMARKNSIGIAPSEYLASNPYADVDEMKLMKRFVLENMMSEIA